MVYLRCRTCGCYLPDSQLTEQGCCSSECADRYRSCVNCGRYYRLDSGYRQQYCCPECAVQYKISRRIETATTLMKELA